MLVAVDTGGTFTDLVVVDESGSIRVHKVPSTPHDPSLAIENALRAAELGAGFELVHGTTVATNALLERKGAVTALITTQGCRDVLEIGRQTREELYSLSPASRIPLISQELRFEVPERLDWRGEVVVPLDTRAVEVALRAAKRAGAESIAVCFLFSFARPEHELEAGRRAQKQGFSVSLSHEIAPEYREYERTSTVCANAIVAPVMERYLGELQRRVNRLGGSRLSVMQSNGGLLPAEQAARSAVKTVLSGPAGGLMAAVRTARQAGIGRIISFDMGGTSTDVALVDGEPLTVRTGEVAGIPLLTPMLDIHTLGAGGGSIARLDAGGGLRVGPHSAGADPGPVAYGRGSRLTVTDANVLLGRIPSDTRLAGTLNLDVERVRDSFISLGAEMNVSPEQAAAGILEVVNAQMARGLRHISVERGHDPGDYTLIAFGGAGPLHACRLAETLRIPKVLVPRFPGAFSAHGMAFADIRREYARSLFAPAREESRPLLETALGEMVKAAREEMASEAVPANKVRLQRFVEARYEGQSYSLRAPYKRSPSAAAREFHNAHRMRYGHSDRSQPVEFVAVGLAVVVPSETPILPPEMPAAAGRPVGLGKLWQEPGYRNVPLFSREALCAGQSIPGPAIILQADATTYIPTGWAAEVDVHANLLLAPSS